MKRHGCLSVAAGVTMLAAGAAWPATAFLEGVPRQGGMLYGHTQPGSSVRLVDPAEGVEYDVPVNERGFFVLGFGRDHGPKAEVHVASADDDLNVIALQVAPHAWAESSITVAQRKANPYLPEDLARIEDDRRRKDAARAQGSDKALWLTRFLWPVDGCISSHFGSRRTVNGTPRRPHSGVDVAAPDGMNPMDYIGTPIHAPSDGIVRLAASDMFFEGGLVLIDHGQGLESALMHLSSVEVDAGTRVSKGDLIGKVGMTGRVTGPHLHWSLKWQDVLLDPTSVVVARPRCTD